MRAKVTGVTVALLAIGLFAAGVGTQGFLREALLASLDQQLESLAPTDVASGLIDIEVDGGEVRFRAKSDAPATQYVVAIYDSDGTLRADAGGDGRQTPVLPEPVTLEWAAKQGLAPFTMPAEEGGAPFRASVDTYPIEGVGSLFTQLVALPTAPINSTVAAFTGIYSILAVIILVASAFLTRWLVTLTFRSLGGVETTAMSIAHGDFSQRMTDIEPTTTEVGRLKTAINAMLDKVDAAIEHRDATVEQMRRFIGDASHELRTPLVTVRGYAELYRMGAIAGDEDTAQAMDRIEKEAIRMGLLVEDLLALARLDERRDVVIGPVDLRAVARDAALDVRAASPLRVVTVLDGATPGAPATSAPVQNQPDEQAARRGPTTSAIARAGATLSLLRRKPRPVPAPGAGGGVPPVPQLDFAHAPAHSGGIAPVVLGDENRIRQVVANLLGNARRFTAEDSPIELRVGVDPESAEGWIEVIDHGEGIPDQIKAKIFQRFWRADTSRTRETGGSGLGLSIVASIVEALHGSVRVLDTPGGGATFRVGIPLAPEREAAEHLHIQTQPLERFPEDEI
ncbi:sensor histidine kinase [Microbacterium immunditiarum]|uniref:histidine kinase n=1 Tax=Microbacterium immunditiarum TaxID=337480 RepID=A0A7Y9GN64_9MICO|nr:HAMP domain-containing sensor histidine kinase [Microbacterium immunditiarum]NYE19576.1 two-component system OmpR family sensor kinase [Microbacterium immunditiarum]